MVWSVHHGVSSRMSDTVQRHLSFVPAGIRGSGARFRFLTDLSRVLSAHQPPKPSLHGVCGADMLGHQNCLRKFFGSHEGHFPGLRSARPVGIGRGLTVFARVRLRVHFREGATLCASDRFFVWFYNADRRRVFLINEEQKDREIPLTLNRLMHANRHRQRSPKVRLFCQQFLLPTGRFGSGC